MFAEEKYLGNKRGYTREVTASFGTSCRWFMDAIAYRGQLQQFEDRDAFNVVKDTEDEVIIEIVLQMDINLDVLEKYILQHYNQMLKEYPENINEAKEDEEELVRLMTAIQNAAIDGFDYITLRTEA